MMGHIQGGLATDSRGPWGTQPQWIHVQYSSSIYDSGSTEEEGGKVVTAKILEDLSCNCLSEKALNKQNLNNDNFSRYTNMGGENVTRSHP